MNTRPTVKQLFVSAFIGVLLLVCDALIQQVQLPPLARGLIGILSWVLAVAVLARYSAATSTAIFPGPLGAVWLAVCVGRAAKNVVQHPEYAVTSIIISVVFALPAVYGIWWSPRRPALPME